MSRTQPSSGCIDSWTLAGESGCFDDCHGWSDSVHRIRDHDRIPGNRAAFPGAGQVDSVGCGIPDRLRPYVNCVWSIINFFVFCIGLDITQWLLEFLSEIRSGSPPSFERDLISPERTSPDSVCFVEPISGSRTIPVSISRSDMAGSSSAREKILCNLIRGATGLMLRMIVESIMELPGRMAFVYEGAHVWVSRTKNY